MISLKGPEMSEEERDLIKSQNLAGVVLFKRNIQSFKQVHALCSRIKSLQNPSPLIAVDLEGGEVNRFSHLKEAFPWPSPEELKKRTPDEICFTAQAMGRMLRLLGIDINFAPVVDLLSKENPLLKARVFGQNKEEIIENAGAFMKGLRKENILPCLKHFPGHGGVFEDSHICRPQDPRNLKELEEQLEIFQELFQKEICWLMTAHIEFSNIDKRPATFSKILLKDLLRMEKGFQGLLVSDDMDMSALNDYSPGESFFSALKGGCNLIITCQKEESPKEILQYFKEHPEKKEEIQKDLEESSQRILSFRKKVPRCPDFKSVEKELQELSQRGRLG